MREYIFTSYEREILNKWLKGEARPKAIDVIFVRLRRAKQLEEDIKLLEKVKSEMKRRNLKV